MLIVVHISYLLTWSFNAVFSVKFPDQNIATVSQLKVDTSPLWFYNLKVHLQFCSSLSLQDLSETAQFQYILSYRPKNILQQHSSSLPAMFTLQNLFSNCSPWAMTMYWALEPNTMQKFLESSSKWWNSWPPNLWKSLCTEKYLWLSKQRKWI